MKSHLFSLFFLFSFISFSQAQTASEWMETINATYKKAVSYYIKFEAVEENTEKISGELYAAKEKYSLQISDIYQMFDGKTLYTVSKDDKEITISKPAADGSDLLTPTKSLELEKTEYTAVLDKTETVNGKKVQKIKLSPKKQNSEINYILVSVYTADNTLYQYKEFLKNGSSRTITVKEYLENLIIPRSLFKFDRAKYEKNGYIVTDL